MKTKLLRSLMLITLLSISTHAFAYDFEVNGICYNITSLTDKTIAVVRKSLSSEDYAGSVVIPESVTYNDTAYSVTSIESQAFYGCSELTSVTIPNSVTSIGYEAFAYCNGLTSIMIPNSVTSIGERTFLSCIGLISIVVESGNTIYDSRANCNAIIETSTNTLITGCKTTVIPNSVTSIGSFACSGRTGMTSITIPNSVTNIGEKAFSNCQGLTSVTIPSSVKNIGTNPFFGCLDLTSIVVENGNTVYDSRDNCNAIIETTTNALITGCKTTVISNSVTSIGELAFFRCRGLINVVIPNSVTSIDVSAFQYCTDLTSIVIENGNTVYDSRDNSSAIIETATNTLIAGCKTTVIPNSVTSIGEEAFYGCADLTSVTIPNSVTSIGDLAFNSCSDLTSVTIPNSVTSIGNRAFQSTGWYNNQPDGILYLDKCCLGYKGEKLTRTLTLTDDTRLIADHAFYFCDGLTSVTIPNSVTSIGDLAFRDCADLTSVTIGNSVTSIGEEAFRYCHGLTSVEIPNSVTSIGDLAFSGCTGLTSVTIGNSVTSIGHSAFSGCTGLTSVTIGNSVTSIGHDAFSDCTGLTSVTIGNSVTSISFNAFSGCTSLTNVTSLNPTPPTCGRGSFSNVTKQNSLLTVPTESLSAYQVAYTWKDFTNIIGKDLSEVDETLADDVDAPAEYYDFNGVRVQNPEKGVYIKRQGGKTTKVVL